MNDVTSKDGTSIAYEREGRGPAVVLVGGAMDDGSENAPLVPELAAGFTVFNYARRGRGESGNTPLARAGTTASGGVCEHLGGGPQGPRPGSSAD
jgi:pimeloyl-ACP methyl ester carboxylesterase